MNTRCISVHRCLNSIKWYSKYLMDTIEQSPNSIVASTLPCRGGDPGSIPGLGVFMELNPSGSLLSNHSKFCGYFLLCAKFEQFVRSRCLGVFMELNPPGSLLLQKILKAPLSLLKHDMLFTLADIYF